MASRFLEYIILFSSRSSLWYIEPRFNSRSYIKMDISIIAYLYHGADLIFEAA